VKSYRPSSNTIDQWIAEQIEASPSSWMTAGEIRRLCHTWHEQHGYSKPELAIWRKMGQQFERKANNGRPIYKVQPKIRLVARST
jgi:hypothetical protein